MSLTQSKSHAVSSNDNAGPGILAESYILLSIAFLLTALRCYVRLRVTKHWGWDDTTIVVAWVILLIGAILVNLEVHQGLGKHLQSLSNPEQQGRNIIKYNTFFQMQNVICTLVTKISISLYILRIKNNKSLRRILWLLMGLMTLGTLTCIIGLSISCIPLKALWDPETKGRCIPLSKVYVTAYVQSGFAILTDLCLTISPIVILWNVKIRKGRKVLICCLMSLGLIATVSNALRNDFQSGLTTHDFPHDMIPVTVVAILELSSGVIAACIPACMPVLKLHKAKPTHPSYELPPSHPSHVRVTTTVSQTSKEEESSEAAQGGESYMWSPLHDKGTIATVSA